METRRGVEARKKRSVDRESPLEERFADGVAIREAKGRIGADTLSSGSRGIIRRSIISMVFVELVKTLLTEKGNQQDVSRFSSAMTG